MKEYYYNLLVEGFENLQAAQDKKTGTLRGGNSGCMTEGGLIIGANPRTAVLRYHGVETPTSFEDDLLFQAGHSNEDNIAAHLSAASGVSFKREEDIPVYWEVTSGGLVIPVTGRPDFKIYSSAVDTFGIELKGIFGTGTLVDVAHFAGGVPKAINVVQSAHYSYKNGYMPWILQYVNRSYHTVFYYGAKRFPLEHPAVKRNDDGKPVVVGPFMTLYSLEWHDDLLHVNEMPTLITGAGIDRYYQYLADCIAGNVVPRAHTACDVFGSPLKKDKESMYYAFESTDHNKPLDAWVAECEQLLWG